MFFSEGKHGRPHFHAYYQKYKISIDIQKCKKISGKIPDRQKRQVLVWADAHKEELLANWESLRKDKPIRKIKPLRI